MSTLVLWLALVPAAAVAIPAWERRKFWRHPDYILVNRSLASLGAGLLLMSPTADDIGDAIEAVTGRWHGEDVIGHTLVIVGFLCLTAHAMRACTWLTSRTAMVATHTVGLFIAILWGIWAWTDMSEEASPTILRDGGKLYWSIMAAGLGTMALIAFGIFAYIHRKVTRPSMIHCARLYMIGSGFLALACGHRGFELVTNSFAATDLLVDYVLRIVSVSAVAMAAHHTFSQIKKPVNVPATLSQSFV